MSSFSASELKEVYEYLRYNREKEYSYAIEFGEYYDRMLKDKFSFPRFKEVYMYIKKNAKKNYMSKTREHMENAEGYNIEIPTLLGEQRNFKHIVNIVYAERSLSPEARIRSKEERLAQLEVNKKNYANRYAQTLKEKESHKEWLKQMRLKEETIKRKNKEELNRQAEEQRRGGYTDAQYAEFRSAQVYKSISNARYQRWLETVEARKREEARTRKEERQREEERMPEEIRLREKARMRYETMLREAARRREEARLVNTHDGIPHLQRPPSPLRTEGDPITISD